MQPTGALLGSVWGSTGSYCADPVSKRRVSGCVTLFSFGERRGVSSQWCTQQYRAEESATEHGGLSEARFLNIVQSLWLTTGDAGALRPLSRIPSGSQVGSRYTK